MSIPSPELCDIRQGDVLERLAEIPADSIDCIITSPPYWGLRDYGVEGQLGLETTLGEHISAMVAVCAELRRVLKPSGTLWLNYGDCYAAAPNGRSAAATKAAGTDDRTFRDKPFSTIQGVLKPKDLCMVPNRLAIALQEAGWWVRSEIVWAKPNPMPESVRDRPATAHEKIFLLTKSARYFYSAEAVRQGRKALCDTDPGAHGKEKKRDEKKRDKQRGHSRRHAGFDSRWDGMDKSEQQAGGRNLRNYEPAPMPVWEMATKPFPDAHFATFPPELVERCLAAGCPSDGVVLDPFGGAGTTGLVAAARGIRSIMIELNPQYAELARQRIDRAFVGPDERQRDSAKAAANPDPGPLFAEVVHG